jgi:glucose/arabinose dehydrogenase|tara:strand:- start:372 stop:1628 length:1257 start_codon:yes stop_codon:yes gene_type:complete
MNLKTLLTFLTLLPLVSFEPITAQIPEPGPSVMRLPVFVKNEELRLSVADGFEVNTLVSNLDSPRWPIVLPNGNILISGSKTEALPNMPEETVRLLTSMNIFGKSPNTIIEIITNTNPPSIKNIIQDLNQPFGIVYIDESLYVANTDAIIKYPFKSYILSGEGKKIIDLPSGPPNNHWTRNIILNSKEDKLLITVGSGTNVNAEGFDETDRAAIWEINLDGSQKRILASGLRNPVGLDFYKENQSLWTTVNERDGIGEFTPPDYLTEVKENGFYGWPYVYFKKYPDPTHSEINPRKVEESKQIALMPDFPLDAHSVPLGLLFHSGKNIPTRYKNGAFVVRRGGVSTSKLTGYDVLFIPFEEGKPKGTIETFLSGFIASEERGEIYGRPVGITEDNIGNILITDDVGGRLLVISQKKEE